MWKYRIEFDNKKVISAHHCYCELSKISGTGKATILYIPKKHFSSNTELKYYESIGSQGMHIQKDFVNCGRNFKLCKRISNFFVKAVY